jgi:hypothetical protein
MLLTSLLLVATLHGGRTAVLATPSETSQATAEGLEILRRILGEAIDGAFPEKAEDGDGTKIGARHTFQLGIVTSLMTGHRAVQHSRAFHLPGVGLFFALDAALPVVAEKEAPEQPAEGLARDDAWERTRREVRGEFLGDGRRMKRAFHVVSAERSEIDPAAIERLIDVVLGTLARHAGRVEGLAPGETVTVALRLSGTQGAWLSDFASADSTLGFTLDESGKPEDGPEEGLFSAYFLASGIEAREQNLVLQVALADLAGFTEESGTGKLRQRARVNLY